MNNRKNTAGRVAELIEPLAQQMNLLLWDVEFVREGARQVLRITIDSPKGISLDDCERLHRAVEPVLDEADPIESAYYLEVSSPGIERELKKPAHFEAQLGHEVEISLYAPDKTGKKKQRGVLAGYERGSILIDTPEGRLVIEEGAAAKVHTVFSFDE